MPDQKKGGKTDIAQRTKLRNPYATAEKSTQPHEHIVSRNVGSVIVFGEPCPNLGIYIRTLRRSEAPMQSLYQGYGSLVELHGAVFPEVV